MVCPHTRRHLDFRGKRSDKCRNVWQAQTSRRYIKAPHPQFAHACSTGSYTNCQCDTTCTPCQPTAGVEQAWGRSACHRCNCPLVTSIANVAIAAAISPPPRRTTQTCQQFLQHQAWLLPPPPPHVSTPSHPTASAVQKPAGANGCCSWRPNCRLLLGASKAVEPSIWLPVTCLCQAHKSASCHLKTFECSACHLIDAAHCGDPLVLLLVLPTSGWTNARSPLPCFILVGS